jgi:hypothetical protein
VTFRPECPREGGDLVRELLLAHVILGILALLVVGFVAYPYRGRRAPLPRSERLTDAVASVADRVDPGEAPPLGVLSSPEKSRAMSERFERVEQRLRKGARMVVTAGRR